MKIAVYSAHDYDKKFLDSTGNGFQFVFIKDALTLETAVLAKDCKGIAIFTSDDASANVLYALKDIGIDFVVTRSTGFDHIDISIADKLNIHVANVPAYSPNAIAEHAVAMMLALSRKLVLSDKKVKEHDFTIDNLIGFNLDGKTAGIIGTGQIGGTTIKILKGFGCRIVAYDIREDSRLVDEYGVEYVPLEVLYQNSDIISIHAPLNTYTTYLVNEKSIGLMKDGVMLINTARGKIINTQDILKAIKSGKIGYLGMDVYENERGIFFKDFKGKTFRDELLQELMTFPNVLITAHQAFLTNEALKNIADTTLFNINCFANNKANPNALNLNISTRQQAEVH